MKSKKLIGAGSLLKLSFQMIKKDYSILLPYLISSFLIVIAGSFFIKTQTIDPTKTPSAELMIFSLFAFVVTLLAQATTVFMTGKLSAKRWFD